MTTPSSADAPIDVETLTVPVGDTSLAVDVRGTGPAVLLIHGGGEDASMLAGQAEAIAAAGYQAIAYDRRGTGRSGHESWPGSGAGQHADDAVGLLDTLGIDRATVLGLSSGGVIALDVAARHPERVDRVIAWEPPAAGAVPDGEAINAEIMAPIDAYLAEHPGDYVGAQAILLTAILGFPVAVDDPAFAAARANAEPMIRDEPTVTGRAFTAADFEGLGDRVTVAVGREPLGLIAAAADEIAGWTGVPTVTLGADHEVYLSDPAVLTALLAG